MEEKDDKYRVYLDGGVGQDPYDPQPLAHDPQLMGEVPFCLGIVGDFSGRGRRLKGGEDPDLARRPLRRVTPENVLNLAGLKPEIVLAGLPEGPPQLSFAFSTMDDFHPDRLYDRLDLFRNHRDARERLKAGGVGVEVEPEAPGSGLLDAILGETERETPKAGSDPDEDLDAFIRRVVRPHAVKAAPDHSERLEELDRQTSVLMRGLMRSPEFQELESLWRSVVFLLSMAEVSTDLRLYLIDVSEAELTADLLSTDEPTEWGFAHTVLGPISEKGEELRWGALLGAFEFGGEPHHVPLLQRIGLLAESGRVPWFAGAHSSLLGSRSLRDQPDPADWTEPLDPLWEELRNTPEAEWINLAFPGFLLRTPYGSGGRLTRRFGFGEEAVFPRDLLWGNPSILWGVVLAREFTRAGWHMRVAGRQTVSGIPLYPTVDGWATCVPVTLSITGASRAQEMGLNPVVAPRNEPEVHLQGPGSISTSEKGLGAWWRNHI
ncbi:MAG: type VI secretion system contractile sheath large subunit [Longimicrobiales bacterium]|nr:type VI secretion system contractile sheath large subunit [Longimicrobiales bacterium]